MGTAPPRRSTAEKDRASGARRQRDRQGGDREEGGDADRAQHGGLLGEGRGSTLRVPDGPRRAPSGCPHRAWRLTATYVRAPSASSSFSAWAAPSRNAQASSICSRSPTIPKSTRFL